MEKKIFFVTTTIHKPEFIEGYFKAAQAFSDDPSNVSFIVIGDLKTPTAVAKYCEQISKQYGNEAIYLSPDNQIKWLENNNLDQLKSILPWNSIQRRNIGFLLAYQKDADIIVSLDDDNYISSNKTIDLFSEIGNKMNLMEINSSNDWFNCCSMLEFTPPHEIYPRGFPYSKRYQNETYRTRRVTKQMVVRAGLWTGSPDVDAITHLEKKTESISLREEYRNNPILLANDVYCPFNTQNTGFISEMLPTMFCIPMGDKVRGMKIDRYDDIWLSFIAEKISHHLNKGIAFGSPLSNHKRNYHNYIDDHINEAMGIKLNEYIFKMILNIPLKGGTYLECYDSAINGFSDQINSHKKDYDLMGFFKKVNNQMRIWHDACKHIM